MSNRKYRKPGRKDWVVVTVLPLAPGGNIRLGRFKTKAEARYALSRVLRGYLKDRRASDSVPMLNRMHVHGNEETHLYFAAGKHFFPALMMTHGEKDASGPISLLELRAGGPDEIRKRANPLVAAWIRAMRTLEQKRAGSAYKLVTRR